LKTDDCDGRFPAFPHPERHARGKDAERVNTAQPRTASGASGLRILECSPYRRRIWLWECGPGMSPRPSAAILASFCLVYSATAQASDASVNAWTKPTSGYWEEPFWSLGKLPAADQAYVAFTNAGWKALAIGQNTTANFSNSLNIQNLIIEAPSDSFNQLLFNYAGTNVPLNVQWLDLGTNASLVSYYSTLKAGSFYVNSPAVFDESSVLNADFIRVYSTLSLSNSFASLGFLWMRPNGQATFSRGGSQVHSAFVEAGGTLTVAEGTFSSDAVCIQAYPSFPVPPLASGVGTFVQAGGDVALGSLTLGSAVYGLRGEYRFEGGSFSCSSLQFNSGIFYQSAGTNLFSATNFPSSGNTYPPSYREAEYILSGGVLLSSNLSLGFASWPYDAPGRITQSGGVHTNSSLVLNGYLASARLAYFQWPHPIGHYALNGGLLVSGTETVSGTVYQSGGTNCTLHLSVGGSGLYALTNGRVVAADASVSGYNSSFFTFSPGGTIFFQQGGVCLVTNAFVVRYLANCDLRGGLLAAQDIHLRESSSLSCRGGVLSNWGSFFLEGGTFTPGSQSHDLGELCVSNATILYWPYPPPTNSFSVTAGTAVRFRDSSRVDWSDDLQIVGWQPRTGAAGSHIFFGTNAQGLTQAQLNRIRFVNPAGWPAGSYPARILETGEIVPAAPPSVNIAAELGQLILTWPGEYELVAATNVLGPYVTVQGATSPFTNMAAEPARYFRLRAPR
jgi:hypothetical protein